MTSKFASAIAGTEFGHRAVFAGAPASLWRRLRTAYVATAVFFISLQSFYFAELGGSVFCYVGLGMLLPLLVASRRETPSTVDWLFFSILFAVCALKLITAADPGPRAVIGLFVGGMAYLIVMRAFAGEARSVFVQALQWAVLLHAGVLLFQVVAYTITRQYIDIAAALGVETTWYSRKGVMIAGAIVPRFTGLFNEPGTFSAVVVGLVAALYVLEQRVTKTVILALIAVLCTLALSGIVLGFAFLLAVVARRIVRREVRLGWGVCGLLVCGALAVWLNANIDKRLSLSGSEGIGQVQMVSWALSGSGLSIFGVPENDIPVQFVVNDAGIWLEALLDYGLVGLAGLLGAVASLGPGGVLFGLVLLGSKLKLTYPLIFLLLGAMRLGARKATNSQARSS